MSRKKRLQLGDVVVFQDTTHRPVLGPAPRCVGTVSGVWDKQAAGRDGYDLRLSCECYLLWLRKSANGWKPSREHEQAYPSEVELIWRP